MSGLAGVMAVEGAPSPEAVAALRRSIARRARAHGREDAEPPDADETAEPGEDGVSVLLRGRTALIAARLSTLDFATGAQPMLDAGGAALAVDGAFANDPSLRNEIGHDAFATGSDAEAALALWRRDGPAGFARLRGGWALALDDPAEERLLLARDPFGQRPLYYVEHETGVAFASDCATLIHAGFAAREISLDRLTELLQLHFCTGRETIFPDIRRVDPGETLTLARGRVVDRARRPSLPAPGAVRLAGDEAQGALGSGISASALARARADVEVVTLISGGPASAAVLASLAAAGGEASQRAVHVAAHGPAMAARRASAERLARATGARLDVIDLDAAAFWRAVPRLATALDDPAADYDAAILDAAFAAMDARPGVALTGDGAAELFARRGRYRNLLRPVWLGGRSMRARGRLDGTGVLANDEARWRDGVVAVERRLEALRGPDGAAATRLQRAQAAELETWVACDVLVRLDRVAAMHGIDARAPFLDEDVAAIAWSLEDGAKIRMGRGGRALARWLEDAHPEVAAAIAPFNDDARSPAPDWIAQEAARLGPLVAGARALGEATRPGTVAALFAALARGGDARLNAKRRRMAVACWGLLFAALWARAHVEGADIAGRDVFEALGD